jgi:hypothetical protein
MASEGVKLDFFCENENQAVIENASRPHSEFWMTDDERLVD